MPQQEVASIPSPSYWVPYDCHIWSSFWAAEINGNGVIVISQTQTEICKCCWSVDFIDSLDAWTPGNPRNYYLHYFDDNAANSCQIEWNELP